MMLPPPGFIGIRRVAAWAVAAFLTTGVATPAAAELAYSGVGVFGEATRPDVLKLASSSLDDELLPVNIGGYWGLINQRIRLTVPPELDWTDDGYDGLARATLRGKTGFLQGNGDWRFVPEFDEVDRFEDGFAVFRGPDGGYGYMDKGKRIRHAPEFKAALRFKDGRAAVQVGDRCGYLDRRMQLVTPLAFTAARSFHDGYAAVRLAEVDRASADADRPGEKQRESAGGEDSSGSPENDGDDYRPHASGINLEPPVGVPAPGPDAAPPDAASAGRWAYINKTGRTVFVDPTGDIQALGDFHDNFARFRANDRWGYLDQQFRPALPPTFEDARDFTNGLAAVKRDGKWGYIDRRFRVAVPFEYEEADDFDEILAMVRYGGKVGFIDRTGRMRIEPEFDWAEPFRRGVARVARNDSFAYIGVSGYVFFEPGDALRYGVVDVRIRENVRAQNPRTRQPYNRFYALSGPRATLPSPYPPEYLYDEGIDADVPWQLGSTP